MTALITFIVKKFNISVMLTLTNNLNFAG